MRASCLPLPVLTFFLLAAGPVRAGELPADFVDACSPAAAKMQDAYEHATIRGNCRLTFPQKHRGATQRTIDFVLRTDGDRMSLTESGGFGADDSPGRTARPPREMEIDGHQARLREGDGAWESTDPGNARGYVGWVTQIRHVYGRHLVDFLRDPARTIDGVESLTEDGRSIVRLSCHWDDPTTKMHNTGVYDFWPAEGWALVRYVNTWQPGDQPAGRYTVNVDYDGLRDGVPLIRRAEEAMSHGPKFETDQLCIVDFIDVQFAEPAAKPAATTSGPQAF